MKKINKDNSGFTLIELIIAMAVLAFLMTAVGTLMGSSIASHKKQKAEIQVHTSAQETYNQLTDSIMQAREVVVIGYESGTAYDFSVPGVDAGATPAIVCYVKSKEMKQFIIDNPSIYGTNGLGDSNIRLFTEFSSDKTFYVKQLSIMNSVPLDVTAAPSAQSKTGYYEIPDALSPGSAEIVKVEIATTASGLNALNKYDNVIKTYTFEGNNMYLEKKYSFMTSLNDTITGADKDPWLYNDGLSYVSTTGTGNADISACTLKVDAKNGAMGIELQFNNKNMTYTTQGMVNIRNSYVLKGKDN